jgi:hypothetical protein
MQDQDFERHDHGTVRVQLCFACAGLWFDHLASVQLAPGAVIELFKEINSRAPGARQALAKLLNCPRCSDALALSFDLSKTGRFSYFMCHRGDGRFTPFTQFLREKQFVRTLTAAELQRVRSQVRQITCHAPVSFLDPEAVAKAVQMWSDADHRQHLRPTPEALSDALLRTHIHPADDSVAPDTQLGAWNVMGATGIGPDLVTMGIHALGRLFMSRD